MRITDITHHVYSIMNPAGTAPYPTEDVIKRIIRLTEGLTNFWKRSEGWAPIEASQLLSKSRLDWQASLARQLNAFAPGVGNRESGQLILAWATLGSLVEGSLKLFLAVYYKVYLKMNAMNELKAVKDKSGNLIDPDELVLEKLRVFFQKRVFAPNAKEIWIQQGEIDWIEWILLIQQRRNAVHAFQHREIGDFDEFYSELTHYLLFLRKINIGLPYPDDIYRPME